MGTGNIWRFPRIAAKNGGGEFLEAWIVFLLLWSIPLVLVGIRVGPQDALGAHPDHSSKSSGLAGLGWAAFACW